jgi:hypothetical protein
MGGEGYAGKQAGEDTFVSSGGWAATWASTEVPSQLLIAQAGDC